MYKRQPIPSGTCLRFVYALICIPFIFLTSALAQLPVTLTTQEALPANAQGVVRANEPVTVGVPLADSDAIWSVTQLGATGTSAAQFRCLAKWPSGNCKWVQVDYVLPNLAQGTQSNTIVLTTGNGNFGGGALASDSNPNNPNAGTITINTGTGGCSFTIQKAHFDVLHSVVCNGKTLINGGSNGLALMGPSYGTMPPTCTFSSTCTQAYTSANDALSVCSVEENGPVRAAVKCSGGLKDGSGNKYMGFVVRLHFFTGRQKVKAVVTLKNADDGAAGSFPISYKGYQSFKLSLATQLTGSNIFSIGDDGRTNGNCSSSGYCTGALSSGQNAYLYQGYSTQNFDSAYNSSMQFGTDSGAGARAAAAADVTRDTSYNYAQDGYVIVGPTGAVMFSGASSIAPTTPMGWADVHDASGGHGISFGTDYMQGNFPRSLEIRNAGQEIDLGISPDQSLWPNTNCTAGISPCQKIYYQPWPEYKVANVDLIFHDRDTNAYGEMGVTAAQNDFLRMQYPLIARAPYFYYNGTGALVYSLVDPAKADAYFNSIAAKYGKSFTTMTDIVPVITRYFDWSQGGNGNQHEIRYADLVHRWLERGHSGRYINATWFTRFQEQFAWERSDGITCTVAGINYHGWACHTPTSDLSPYNSSPSKCTFKNANQCNDSGGMLPNNCTAGTGCSGGYVDPLADENSASRHYHWWSAIYNYLMTGDEDIADMLKDGVVNEYTAIGAAGNYVSMSGNGNIARTPQFNLSWQSSGTNNRLIGSGSFGGRLGSAAHYWRFLSDIGDTADANYVDVLIRNLLTVMYHEPCATTGTGSHNANYPPGCTPTYDGSSVGQEMRGFSAYRGLFLGAGEGNNQSRCTPAQGQDVTAGGYVRCIEPFMQGYLLDSIWALTQLEGPGWSEYQKLFDLGYGDAINTDATNYVVGLANAPLPSNSQLIYTMAFDQPNNLTWYNQSTDSDTNGPGPPMEGIYYLWGHYTGDLSAWQSHWENTFINRASGTTYTPNNMPEYGSQLTDEVVSLILNPPSSRLRTLCSGNWQQAGCSASYNAGVWTLKWTSPGNVAQYYLKENDGKVIVENIGWNVVTNQPIGDAAHSYNWFAASYTAVQPGPSATSITVAAPANANFMLKVRTGSDGTGGGGGGGGGGQTGAGDLYSAVVDSSTNFVAQDDATANFACAICYFHGPADIMNGQTLEVRLASGGNSAAEVVLKEGTIDGQVVSVQSDRFVFVPFNPLFGGQQLTVLTGSTTTFENLTGLPTVGANVAVRGLLLRSIPGGPSIAASKVALIQ